MLVVASRRRGPNGELWLTERDQEQWVWIFSALPILVHQDRELLPGPYLQQSSDVDLRTLPYYLCKVPSVLFFPYVTYFVGMWFHMSPSFVIPRVPLDRWEGRRWLDGYEAFHPISLVNSKPPETRLAWIDRNGKPRPDSETEYLEVVRLASAVKTYLLDEIRYVYDESKSSSDGTKSNVPSRYQFSAEVAKLDATRSYLNWYIDKVNDFFSRLITVGKQDDKVERERCLIAGWTVNRLAVDAVAISSIDVPYVRKWQFFGFLDGLAALKNELDGTGHEPGADKRTATGMLEPSFFQNYLMPVLDQIPIKAIRDEVVAHTENIYGAIDNMGTTHLTGQDLLWAYRNSRHGYAVRDRETLFLHSGKVPDDFPDLTIALWHYLLLNFPFRY